MILISPAKTLDFETSVPVARQTAGRFPDEVAALVAQLKTYSAAQLGQMMQLSSALAALNHHRYANWKHTPTANQTRAALFAYNGPVYTGMSPYSWDAATIDYAQTHLRIVSGLYGIVRPLDAIQPYRLEMATTIDTDAGSSLYEFWNKRLSEMVANDMRQNNDSLLINLASDEYSKAVLHKDFPFRVVTPQFKDYKNGTYKMITIYAKRARGLMARFILENRLTSSEELQRFDLEGYFFSEQHSNNKNLVFLR